jgi:hypothetical protein
MDQHQPERLIAGIKSKKELRSLSLEFVRQQVDLFFRQNPKLLPYLNNPRSEKYFFAFIIGNQIKSVSFSLS